MYKAVAVFLQESSCSMHKVEFHSNGVNGNIFREGFLYKLSRLEMEKNIEGAILNDAQVSMWFYPLSVRLTIELLI